VLIADKNGLGPSRFEFSTVWALTRLYLGDRRPEMMEYRLQGPYNDVIMVPQAFHIGVLVPGYCPGEAGHRIIFPQHITEEDIEELKAWNRLQLKEKFRDELLREWYGNMP
jgi:hypothetical protein